MERVFRHFRESAKLLGEMSLEGGLIEEVAIATIEINKAFQNNCRLYIAGNGGSHADAQHFAAELVGYYLGGEEPLPAIALGSNSAFESAWGNDVAFEDKFARELRAYGREGDIYFAISTSGNSQNLIRGAEMAKRIGMFSIALLGKGGGKLRRGVDLPIIVPSVATPQIQVAHIMMIHAICEGIDRK